MLSNSTCTAPLYTEVYEFVCRHFLATCSLPAIAHKTKVEIDMGGESFRATGIMIKEYNYLDVYGKGPVAGPRLDPSYDGRGLSRAHNRPLSLKPNLSCFTIFTTICTTEVTT